jgi:hypothetical protein
MAIGSPEVADAADDRSGKSISEDAVRGVSQFTRRPNFWKYTLKHDPKKLQIDAVLRGETTF